MSVTSLARVAATLSIFAAVPAFAQDGAVAATTLAQASAKLTPGRYMWQDDTAAGALTVRVSIADQRLYVYRGATLVAVSTVSTGKAGKETPVGVFTILQKKPMNYSTLYNNAPMPFMQRLTWDGIAIHAGRIPGFPASHGCVRVPAEFAKKLYAATALGAVVEVTDQPWDESAAPPVSDTDNTAAANRAAAEAAVAPTVIAAR